MSSGYDDLVATLLHAELTVPPVPAWFRPRLIRRGAWVWSTRPINAAAMYRFDRYGEEALAGPVDDYLAISHAGHRVNSYGLNYHLAYGPLAIFTQNPWGGAYADPAWSRAKVAVTFRFGADLLAITEEHWSAGRQQPDDQLIVAYSDFRGSPGGGYGLLSLHPMASPDGAPT